MTLEAERKEKGWTRTELERRSGVSAQTIYLIESGRVRQPTLETAYKLAEALGSPVEALFAPNGSSDEGETADAAPPATAPADRPVASTPSDRTAQAEPAGKSGEGK